MMMRVVVDGGWRVGRQRTGAAAAFERMMENATIWMEIVDEIAKLWIGIKFRLHKFH